MGHAFQRGKDALRQPQKHRRRQQQHSNTGPQDHEKGVSLGDGKWLFQHTDIQHAHIVAKAVRQR